MKVFIISISILLTLNNNDRLAGSIWTCKIANGCIDTLKFMTKEKVTDYNCEQDYTFHGSYIISKDTLVITEKDDSHSEDGGKTSFFRSKFLMSEKNVLYLINNGELIKGKWKYKSAQLLHSFYKKIN
jgi:hypothetical protein